MQRVIVFVTLSLGFSCPVLAAGGPPSPREIASARSALGRVQIDLSNIENTLAVNRNTINNLVAEAQYFPIERRLVDADLFFEVKDFEKSAVLYRDLVDNPGFVGNSSYYKVVFKLGESLFQGRNLVSARKYFKMAAVPAAGPQFNLAVARLFDLAVVTRDFADCEQFEQLMSMGAIASPDLYYSYAKFLYHKGNRTKAEETFAKVAAGTPPHARAQYFLGVIQTTAKRHDAAIAAFSTAAAQKPASESDNDVKALAILGKARVLYEMGKFRESIEALQDVDPKSSAYLPGLLDAAWSHVKLNDIPHALQTIEVLLMTAPPGEIALKGSALRGRLLTRVNDPDGATEAYNEVSSTLSPVTTELDKISNDPAELKAYFDWIIERESSKFKMEVPISERTRKWVEADPDMATIVSIFSDLSREKDDVQESLEMVEKLLWALRTAGGKIEAFPALRDQVLRLKEIEARLVGLDLDAAVATREMARDRLPAGVADRYERAVKAREAAAERFRAAPKTFDEFVNRGKKVSGEYSEVEKELFLVEAVLKMERQQVLAIEEWLKDAQFREGQGRLSPQRETEIRAGLDSEKRALNDIYQEVLRLREGLEREKVVVNSQTELIRDDDAVRAALLKALAEESSALSSAAGQVDAGMGEVFRQFADVNGRVVAGISAVNPLVRSVYTVAEKGAVEYENVVLREQQRLQTSAAELQKAELDSRAFAQNEGSAVFKNVRDRLSSVLFEADLGLVDMAWQQTQAVAERLRALGKDRADQMKGVEEARQKLEALKGAQGTKLPAPAPK